MATLDPFVELLSGEPIYWESGHASIAISTNTSAPVAHQVAQVTGTASAVAVAVGTPEQTHAVAVAVAAVVQTAGAAEQVHALTAAASSVAQASGVLTLTRALTGDAQAVAEASGTLEQVHAATGSAQAVAETAGAGSQTHVLTAASSAVASAVGVLTVVGLHPVTGAAQAVAEALATPTQTHALTVDVDASVHTGEAPLPPHLDLPGTGGHFAETPDHASLDITGDIRLIADVSLADVTPAVEERLIFKWSGTERSYGMAIGTTGLVRIQWSTNGVDQPVLSSSVAIPYVADQRFQVRADFDVDAGASDKEVTFFTRLPGEAWVQLGSVINQAGTTSIHSGTEALSVGASDGGGFGGVEGQLYAAQVFDGIGGSPTLVADFNANDFSIGDSDTDTAVDSTGKTWTIRGTGSFIRVNGTALEQTHAVTVDVVAVASAVGVLTIGGANNLVGAVQAVSTTTATPFQTHALTVAVNTVTSAVGTPTQTHALTVSVQAVATTAATVDITRPLNGAAQAVASVTATAVQAHRLTADSVAVVVTTATVDVVKFLTADNVQAVAVTTGALTLTVFVAVTKGFNGVDDALVGRLALTDVLVGAVGLDDASGVVS